MYSNLPNLILAFHGCDEKTFENVLYNHEGLLPSNNSYDWLGNGIYFWVNPNCIKGYFKPLAPDTKWTIV